MLIGLNFFIMRTKTGKAIRAVSEDKEVAALVQLEADRKDLMAEFKTFSNETKKSWSSWRRRKREQREPH